MDGRRTKDESGAPGGNAGESGKTVDANEPGSAGRDARDRQPDFGGTSVRFKDESAGSTTDQATNGALATARIVAGAFA